MTRTIARRRVRVANAAYRWWGTSEKLSSMAAHARSMFWKVGNIGERVGLGTHLFPVVTGKLVTLCAVHLVRLDVMPKV